MGVPSPHSGRSSLQEKNNHTKTIGERLGAPTVVPDRSGWEGPYRWYSQPTSPWPRWPWLQWCRPCHAAPPGWTPSGPASWTPRLRRTTGRQRRMTETAVSTTLCCCSLCFFVPNRHMENSSDTGGLGSGTMLTCPNSTTWYLTTESKELLAALRTGTECQPRHLRAMQPGANSHLVLGCLL